MMRHTAKLLCCLAGGLLLVSLPAAWAGNTWDGGGGNNNWTTAANWDSDTLPSYGTLTFSGSTRLINTNDNGSYSMNGINFNSTSAFTLRGNTVDFFDDGGTQAKIENNSTGTGTIDLTVDFEATAGTARAEINPVSGDLIFNSTVNMNGSSVNEIQVFGGSSHSATFNAAINGSSKKVIIQDYNVLIYNAAMGYTGNTEIDQGEIWIGASGSINASSAIYVGNGSETGQDCKLFINDSDGGKTMSNNININAGDGTIENRELGGLNTSGTNIFSGNIVRATGGDNRAISIHIPSGGAIEFSGVISGDDVVRKRSPGTLVLSGAHTHTGNTEIDAGSVFMSAGGSIAGGTVYIGNGSTTGVSANFLIIDVNGGTTVARTLFINPGNGTNRIIGASNTSGVNTYSGAIDRDADGDNETVVLRASSGGIVDYTGAFDGNDPVIVDGGGITRFSTTAKTYTGATIITNSSTLRLNAANLISDSSAVTVESGSTFDMDDNDETVGSIAGGGNITMGSGQLIAGGDNSSTTLSGLLSGSDEFVKNGSGTLTLSGANTFGGDTFAVGGALRFDVNQAAGFTGTINLGETSGSDAATLAIGAGGVTIGNDLLVRTGSSGTKTLSALGTSGTATFSGALDLSDSLTLSANAGSDMTLSGDLDMSSSGDNDLTVTGSDDVTLSGQIDADTGAAEISHNGSGTLLISADNSAGVNQMKLNIGGGGILEITSANSFGDAPAGAYPDKLNFNSSGGALYLEVDISLDSDWGMTIADGVMAGFTVGNGVSDDLTVNGVISDGGANDGAVVMDGPGDLLLYGANTYGGPTYVSNGVVRIQADSGLGTAPGSATPGHLVLDGAELYDFGVSATLSANRGIELKSGGGTFRVTSGETLGYAGIIAGPGALTKDGSGSLDLRGSANTYTGTTTILTGSVLIDDDANLGAAPASAVAGHLELQGATLYANGSSVALNANRGILLGSGGGTLQVTSGHTLTYGGIIAGSTGLTKTGAGQVTLSGANTYSGATDVDTGEFVVNGSADSSAFAVDAGTVVGGEGSIGSLALSGQVAPGNAVDGDVGEFEVSAFTIEANSTYRWELGDASGSTDRDVIKVGATGAGTTTINASSGSECTIYLDDSEISNWSFIGDKSWILIDAGTLTGFDTNAFILDSSTYWSADLNGGTFSVSNNSGDLVLHFSAVPGPILYAAPTNLSFTAQRGSDPSPDFQTFVVSNSNIGTLQFTNTLTYGSGASGWLSLSAISGELTAGESMVVTASVSSVYLPRGEYVLTNTITSAEGAGTELIEITLSVTGFTDTVIYDTFDYTAANGIEGQGGGTGWSMVWTNNSDAEITPLPYVGSSSLASFDNYCNDGGNDAAVDMGNCGGGGEAACANLLREAYREFDAISSGVIYLGFKVKAQFMGTGKDFGVTLGDGGTAKVQIGKVGATSDDLGILTDGVTLTAYTLSAGSDYLVIVRYDLDTGEVKTQGYFGNNLGTQESWQTNTRFVPSGAVSINRLTLYARNGAGGETAGIVEWDDVRVARTWSDLLCGLDYPQGYPVVNSATFHALDVSNRVSDATLASGAFPISATFYDIYKVVTDNTNNPYFVFNYDLVNSDGDNIVQDYLFDTTNFQQNGDVVIGSNATIAVSDFSAIPIGDVTLGLECDQFQRSLSHQFQRGCCGIEHHLRGLRRRSAGAGAAPRLCRPDLRAWWTRANQHF